MNFGAGSTVLHRTTVSTTIGTSYPSHFLSFRDFRHTEYMFSLQGARTSCDYPTIAPSKCPRGRPRKPESKLSVDNLRSRRKKRPRGRPRKPKITLELILTPESPPIDHCLRLPRTTRNDNRSICETGVRTEDAHFYSRPRGFPTQKMGRPRKLRRRKPLTLRGEEMREKLRLEAKRRSRYPAASVAPVVQHVPRSGTHTLPESACALPHCATACQNLTIYMDMSVYL